MNPVPEGKYLDLHTGTVRTLLLPEAGFDLSVEPELDVVPILSRTLTSTLKVGANTILQGEGMGKTILTAGHNGMLLTARGAGLENIIIRDLSIVGRGGDNEYGLLVEYAKNVLIERCEILNVGRRGAGWEEGVERFTFRYCVVDGVGQYHCLSCKDDDEQKRTRNFAVYSNRFRNAGSYGFDCHAEGIGEVCGNIIENTKHGWKFPDCAITDNVLVHHNWVQQSDQGTKVDITLDIGKVRRLFFFNNHKMPPFQLKEGVTVIAINNDYHSGSHRTGGATLITDPAAPEVDPIRPYLDDTPAEPPPTEPPSEPPPVEPPVEPPPTEPPTAALTDAQRAEVLQLIHESLAPGTQLSEQQAHRSAEIADGMVRRTIVEALQ